MKYFEEAFTSKNWIVRLYKVKERGNRNGIEIEKGEEDVSIQSMSQLSGANKGRLSKGVSKKFQAKFVI